LIVYRAILANFINVVDGTSAGPGEEQARGADFAGAEDDPDPAIADVIGCDSSWRKRYWVIESEPSPTLRGTWTHTDRLKSFEKNFFRLT
jgi:hypothetical protein